MPSPFLFFIVLHCLQKLNGERTIYSIYHLLYGKKSSQTIQDAHLFQLTQFFGTYRKFTRSQLDFIIQELQKLNFIVRTVDDTYILTKRGVEITESRLKDSNFLLNLDGWNFQGAEVFWERLSLLVQVSSQLLQNDSKYLPIQKNKQVQVWLKSFLQKKFYKRENLSTILFEELILCFKQVRDISPAILVIRLTGYRAIGITEEQACETLEMEPTLYHYQFQALLHQMMKEVQNNHIDFPLLNILAMDLQKEIQLTESTKKTFELLKKGYEIEEIAQIRKLKNSTIQDHIVELSLQMEEFDILGFVDNEKISRILEAVYKIGSKQLKHIRELVPDASYFEIRLAMTKLGEET